MTTINRTDNKTWAVSVVNWEEKVILGLRSRDILFPEYKCSQSWRCRRCDL